MGRQKSVMGDASAEEIVPQSSYLVAVSLGMYWVCLLLTEAKELGFEIPVSLWPAWSTQWASN